MSGSRFSASEAAWRQVQAANKALKQQRISWRERLAQRFLLRDGWATPASNGLGNALLRYSDAVAGELRQELDDALLELSRLQEQEQELQ